MNLTDLGFDAWVENHAAGMLQPGMDLARVTAVDRDAYRVRGERGEVHAAPSGRFRFETREAVDLPCVGDWVAVRWPSAGGPAILHGVLPRRTFLRRKSAGRTVDFQMIAANIDVAFIVQGCANDFNIPRLERYLVAIHDGGIEPRIVLSKTDQASPAEVEERIGSIRCAGISAPVLALSCVTEAGLAELRAGLARGRTHCLLGSSGVGKTTLINRLMGQETLETRAVSSTGEGVHTTSRRHLLVLEGGAMLIDTPGMREFGLLGTGESVDATFADIGDRATHCRFPDCTHTREPGCAVLAALESGELGEARYRGYLKLRKETEFHDLSYAEKRQKDRAFGRFLKTAKKQTGP